MDSTARSSAILAETEESIIKWIKKYGSVNKPPSKLIESTFSPSVICAKAQANYESIRKKEALKDKNNNHDNLDNGDGTGEKMRFDKEWYEVFRRKTCLQKHSLQLKPFSSKVNSNFIDEFNRIISSGQYNRRQIWMGVHFGLFYRRMPDESILAEFDAKKCGRKRSGKHVSILVTGNISFENDFENQYQLKPLVVVHHKKVNSKWSVDNVILASDPDKARLTKEIMLNWLRNDFLDEVNFFCQKQGIPTKVILLLSDCFRHYFENEPINPSVKIIFFSDDSENELGLVYDAKSSLVEPFISSYINRTLSYLDIQSSFSPKKSIDGNSVSRSASEKIIKIWSELDKDETGIEWTIQTIQHLTIEHSFHIFALRAKFCPTCSPFLDEQQQTNSQKFARRSNALTDIIEQANKLELKFTMTNLIDLIDYNYYKLNNDVLIEKAPNQNEQPLPVPAAQPVPPRTPKRARESTSGLSEKTISEIRTQKDNLLNAKEFLENAVNIFSKEKIDKKDIESAINLCNKKLKTIEHQLALTKTQTSIQDYFQARSDSKSSK